MRFWRILGGNSIWLAVLAAPLNAADAPPAAEKISYYKQIRPIFQTHCQGCHQPAKQGGAYVMTSFDALRKGGESELAAIVAGKPAESHLIEQITPKEGKADMPKGKPPLTPPDLELVSAWISQGAADDTPESTKARFDMAHPPTYVLPPVITSLDFAPDGQLLAASGFHEVLLLKPDGAEIVARLVGMSERIEAVRFSPDGKLLAVTGGLPARMGEVQIWDVAARKLNLSIPVTYDTVYGASWSPDGAMVAFGCADNTVRAINSATGEQVLFSGAHNDWVLNTIFSTDASHMVSVGRDRTMKLIDVKTQRFIDNITSITPGALKGGISTVDRHPTKDELAVGGSDGVPKTYRMYRTQTRVIGDDFQRILTMDAMPGRVFAVRYSRDGNFIVAGSSSDRQGEARVYQSADGKLLWKFACDPVYCVGFSADGKQVAAGGFDGKIRLLDTASGQLVKDFVPVPLTEKKTVAGAAK